MAKTVIALMDNLADAQAVVRELGDAGIRSEDIGFMANQKHEIPATAHLNESEGSGTATGAVTGAALGGVAGLALALAPIAIPGIGALLAAGPIAAALAGAGIGAVAGGVIGGLTNLGVPEEEAHYYAEAVRRGGILVTVAADRKALADKAAEIMKLHGAIDIDQRATEWKRQGWQGRFEANDELPALPAANDVIQQEESVYAARVYPKPAKKRSQKKTEPIYSGPERRVNTTPWLGEERRKAA